MPPVTMPSESVYNELVDSLSVGIICVDRALDVITINAAGESILQVSAVKAHGQNLLDLLELPDSLLSRMHETLHSGQPFSDREVNLAPTGSSPLLVDCTISSWTSNRASAGLLLELNALNRPMRIAREGSLLMQQQQTSSLMRGLAHEIKNPLGGIRGAAQLLENELQDASLHEYTRIIIRESDRLRQLIDGMLGPGNRLDMRRLNIHEVLEHVRKIVSVEASNGIRLNIDYDPSIPELVSDHDRLVQVFLNIARNALNAIGDDGTIVFKSRIVSNFTIGATRHPLAIRVDISDDGTGISDELREQIFLPLVSGSALGTGLGLSIAQTTMHQLGGLIECESQPEQTVFSIILPLEANTPDSTGHLLK